MTKDIGVDANIDRIRIKEVASPSTPASGYGYIYAKTDGLYFKGDNGTEVGPLAGASGSSNHGYYQYLAALLEPDAIESLQKDTFSYAVASDETKILTSSWNTRIGSAGRIEVRNPRMPVYLRGVTLSGIGSAATASIIDPALPTYADARDTYFDRMLEIATSTPRFLPVADTTKQPFLMGAYGGIVLQVTNLDFAWVGLLAEGGVYGFNLADEISDSASFRVSNSPYLCVSKKIVHEAIGAAGASQNGGILYFLCPSTWSAFTDSTTYLFRDDFMASVLDTTTNWNTPTQSSAGNIAINTQYQWLKVIGTSTWGQNGVHSQYNTARTSGKKFICDVYTALSSNNHTGNSCIVGWHDGAGDSYSDFVHGILFTSSGAAPQLQVYENGNYRGPVGSGYTLGTVYRVRITLDSAGANSAKYEIQGGAYGALESASWTDITPGTTSSSTTPVYAGIASGQTNTFYVGDVKITT